jgi:hypothetical protein
MTPTIAPLHGGLQIDGLPGGPHFLLPPVARMLVLGLSFAPIELCPCHAPERVVAVQEAGA